VLTKDDPNHNRQEIAADVPAVFPGQTFAGKRVSGVEHRIAPDRVRTVGLLRGLMARGFDRFKAALASLVRSLVGNTIVGPRVDYLAAYPCKAVKQNSDGTLEMVPDDKRIPGLSNGADPLRRAGLSATISPARRGSLLEFAGGDPQKPYATVWESASVTQCDRPPARSSSAAAERPRRSSRARAYATHMGQAVTAANALHAAITPLMLPPAAAAAKVAITSLVAALTALQGDVSTQNTTL
jgi:hypothetical protein